MPTMEKQGHKTKYKTHDGKEHENDPSTKITIGSEVHHTGLKVEDKHIDTDGKLHIRCFEEEHCKVKVGGKTYTVSGSEIVTGADISNVNSPTVSSVSTSEALSLSSSATDPKFVIYLSGGIYYSKNYITNVVLTSNASLNAVLSSTFDALTPGRTVKEKISLQGDLKVTGQIHIPSYTILELVGTIGWDTTYQYAMLIYTDSQTNIEVTGGIWYGPSAASDSCIYFINCSNISIHNCEISGNGGRGGLELNGCQNSSIISNNVHNGADGNGIQVSQASSNVEISYNIVTDIAWNGISLFTNNDAIVSVMSNIWVHNNTLTRILHDGIVLYPDGFEDSIINCTIEYNTITDAGYNGGGAMISVQGDGYDAYELSPTDNGNGHCDDCVIRYNKCYESGTYSCGGMVYISGRRHQVYNNECHNSSTSAMALSIANNCVINNNLVDVTRTSGGHGIIIAGSNDNTISNNRFFSVMGYNVRILADARYGGSSRNTISGNTIDTPTTGGSCMGIDGPSALLVNQKINGGTGVQTANHILNNIFINIGARGFIDDLGTGTVNSRSEDLSASIYFPTVGNQGHQGSCASWAMTYYCLGYQAAKANGWADCHDITSENIYFNSTAHFAVTKIYISVNDINSIATIPMNVGDIITFTSRSDANLSNIYKINGISTIDTTIILSVNYLQYRGSAFTSQNITDMMHSVSIIPYIYSNATTPGYVNQYIRTNNIAPSSVTQIYVADVDSNNNTQTSALNSILVGDEIFLYDNNNIPASTLYKVSSIVNSGNYHTLNVTVIMAGGNYFSSGNSITFYRSTPSNSYYINTYGPGNPAHLLSPAWSYNREVSGTDSGTFMDSIATTISSWGCATLDYVPYIDTDVITWSGSFTGQREAPLHKVSSIVDMSMTDVNLIADLKAQLDVGIPVTIAIDANQYSKMDSQYIMSSVMYTSTNINHAQCIVGYDDSLFNTAYPSEVGCFKIVNSWGQSFGLGGFWWATYACISKMAAQITLYPQYAIYKIGQPKFLTVINFTGNVNRVSTLNQYLKNRAGTNQATKTMYYGTTPNIPTAYYPNPMIMDASEFSSKYVSGSIDVFAINFAYTGTLTGTVSLITEEGYTTPYTIGNPLYTASNSNLNAIPFTIPITLTEGTPPVTVTRRKSISGGAAYGGISFY